MFRDDAAEMPHFIHYCLVLRHYAMIQPKARRLISAAFRIITLCRKPARGHAMAAMAGHSNARHPLPRDIYYLPR